jgi:hypothetical protein
VLSTDCRMLTAIFQRPRALRRNLKIADSMQRSNSE